MSIDLTKPVSKITVDGDDLPLYHNLEDVVVVPSTEQQEITAGEGYDGIGEVICQAVTSSIDANIIAGNIKKNVNILGVTGNYEGAGPIKNILDITKKTDSLFKSANTLTSVTDDLLPYNSTENVTSARDMFSMCSGLRSVSLFDTSKITDAYRMFFSCTNLTSLPLFDFSSVTNTDTMFNGCSGLTEVPLFNFSNATNMSSTFNGCANLTAIPLFDTSSATNMSSMFSQCVRLTTIPLLNTSKVTNMSNMFYICNSLTTIPLLDTSKVTNISFMFFNCSNLESIPALDFSAVTSATTLTFNGCSKLKEFHATGLKVSFDLSSSTLYTESDLVEVLNNLGTVATTQTLTLGATNLAKLTAEEQAIATNKGWTLA